MTKVVKTARPIKALICDGCLLKFQAIEGEALPDLRTRAYAAGWAPAPLNVDRCPACAPKYQPQPELKKQRKERLDMIADPVQAAKEGIKSRKRTP